MTSLVTRSGIQPFCLGVTGNGQPRHPGRMAYATALVPFGGRDVMSTEGEPGTACTLHFDPPYSPSPDVPQYKTAGHYTGWAGDLEARLAEHEAGRGARLTQVQKEAGGSWWLAAAEPGGRDRERQLKQHGAGRRCPICISEREASQEMEAEAGT